MTTTVATAHPAETGAPMTHRQVLVSISGIMLAMLTTVLSNTVVSTSLPVIVHDLGGGQTAYSWVVTSSLLAMTVGLANQEPLLEAERTNIEFFERLPTADRSRVDFGTVRGTQFLEPLFEFSGACAGCGETPYLKLLSQLFGDRLTVANATGCSSIYGGNLPTTPWTIGADGRGPAWSNSLFEDNAEFGLGLRLSADRHT